MRLEVLSGCHQAKGVGEESISLLMFPEAASRAFRRVANLKPIPQSASLSKQSFFTGRQGLCFNLLTEQCPGVGGGAWYLVTKFMSDSFMTPWTVAHQAPLSMGFSRQ